MAAERARARRNVAVVVEAGLLPDGTTMLLVPPASTPTQDLVREWVAADENRGRARWANRSSMPLVWNFDGKSDSPSGPAEHIFTLATHRKPGEIQGDGVVGGARAWG
ncbi:hypothetical protein [Actinokineospora globicatena]|uniref:Uncharacterized protein n=1 Tax=Actinokineospora globicatena TaxID=103729 RepID=A0A9W6V6R5_9PSEU|nr:hypothetical protein [Actinokineospora globicatena]GLW90647.1 hypothetical protein Aglo03_14630 [Actinokineospora globicatena]